jgi:hypothetical protein
MSYIPSLASDEWMATLCPIDANYANPENFLKTKGRERAFFSANPENILIRKPVTKIIEARK